MIRHLYLSILCLFILLVCSYRAAAQSTGIGLTLLNYTVETNQGNVNLGRTVTINAVITNYDTSDFEGTLDFGLRNTQQQLSNTGLFDKPPYSGNVITLSPGETVPAVFSVEIDASYFTPGPDVVVVWPISASPIADSVVISLNIFTPTSIQEEEPLAFSYIVMADRVMIQNLAIDNAFEQVRIYSMLGQVVMGINSNANEIPIGSLPKGLYICELKSGKMRSVFKFAK